MSEAVRRRLSLLPLGVLTTGAILVSLGTPALAVTGNITSPGNGSVFSGYAPIDISASLRRGVVNDGGRVALSITTATGSTHEVASAAGNTNSMSFSFTPNCPSYPGVGCDGHPANNGQYIVRLTGSGVNDQRTFTMRVAPAKPTGLTAEKTGQRQITLRWTRGAEADLLSYDVFTDEGTFLQSVAANTTAFVIDYGQDRYGGEHGFQIRSARRTCPSCDTNALLSPMSAVASATLTEPSPEPPPSPTPSTEPSPDPTTSPTPGGGFGNPTPTSGTGGGGTSQPTTGTGGGGGATRPPGGFGNPSASTNPTKSAVSGTNQRTAFSLSFKQFAPSLGVPKLPPLPELPEYIEEDGEYGSTLGYGERYEDVAVGGFGEGGVREVVEDVISTVFEGGRLWTSIAASLLLLLGAGHLRLWLNVGRRD